WPPYAAEILPEDHEAAVLVGRVGTPDGPCVVTVRGGRLVDITASAPTMRDLAESADPVALVRGADGPDLGALEDVAAATPPEVRDGPVRLLSPIDLQAVKAAGVTFAVSMVEQVIEERCGGNADLAASMRAEITARIGGDLSTLTPGSAETDR